MPEASVIRRVQALSGITGRKEYRRRLVKWWVKAWGSTPEMPTKLAYLWKFGGIGILGGGVKSVDIKKNTNGEGRYLGFSRR